MNDPDVNDKIQEEGDIDSGKGVTGGVTQTVVKTNLGNDIDITPSSNHTTTTVQPSIEGPPNSSVDYLDNAGNIIQRRWYDSNGECFVMWT